MHHYYVGRFSQQLRNRLKGRFTINLTFNSSPYRENANTLFKDSEEKKETSCVTCSRFEEIPTYRTMFLFPFVSISSKIRSKML